MFGSEKYSKEGHEELERVVDTAKDSVKNRKRDTSFMGLYQEPLIHGGLTEYDRMVEEHDWRRLEEAQKALKNMEMAGKTEAEALNKEYDRLRARTAAAMNEQRVFEIEKLGMYEKEGEDETEVAA